MCLLEGGGQARAENLYSLLPPIQNYCTFLSWFRVRDINTVIFVKRNSNHRHFLLNVDITNPTIHEYIYFWRELESFNYNI
jgi:hypothetical protein